MIRCVALKGIAGHDDSFRWLTAFVRLYEPVIGKVLRARDRRLTMQACPAAARDDRQIEVVAMARLDWLANPNCIDHELTPRGLEPDP